MSLTSAMWRPAAAEASSGVSPRWRASMYAAYQSHQSCDCLERAVMLGHLVQKLCEIRNVHRHTRPGSRSVISRSSGPLPSGSLNEAYVP
jgi:hypothetical protein